MRGEQEGEEAPRLCFERGVLRVEGGRVNGVAGTPIPTEPMQVLFGRLEKMQVDDPHRICRRISTRDEPNENESSRIPRELRDLAVDHPLQGAAELRSRWEAGARGAGGGLWFPLSRGGRRLGHHLGLFVPHLLLPILAGAVDDEVVEGHDGQDGGNRQNPRVVVDELHCGSPFFPPVADVVGVPRLSYISLKVNTSRLKPLRSEGKKDILEAL